MSVLHWILAIFLGFLSIGIIYWMWGIIGGLLMAGSVGIGYGLGKFIGIKPRSEVQTNTLVMINSLLQIGIEWGICIWAVSYIINLNLDVRWLKTVENISGAVWLFSLAADMLILFLMGLIFGKVESLEKLEIIKNKVPEISQIVYCPKCQKKVSVSANFCKHCGIKIN